MLDIGRWGGRKQGEQDWKAEENLKAHTEKGQLKATLIIQNACSPSPVTDHLLHARCCYMLLQPCVF